MKRFKSVAIVGLLPLVVGAAFNPLRAAAQSERHGAAPATISSAADRWGAAFNAGDLDALVSLYTEDAELLPKGTQAIRGYAAIREFLSALMASKPATQRSIFTNVQRFGTGDAVSEVADVETVDTQGHRTIVGRQILILLKQNGQWKIHRDMWTKNEKSAS